jgi:hypothetical protein
MYIGYVCKRVVENWILDTPWTNLMTYKAAEIHVVNLVPHRLVSHTQL